MRVLFLTGSAASYMAPPLLGDEQITGGPDWTDHRTEDGRWRALKTPVGEYDVATVLARIPPEQKPDVLACLVDASWRNLPRNLGAFHGPKVLLVADTHHLQAPLTTMIRYAATEPFDRVTFLYDRHHAAIFRAAGFRNLYWFPGLTFPHDDATVRASWRTGARLPQVAFVGQAGKFHPRRSRLLGALNAARLPVAQRPLSQPDALKFYASSLVGFNSSLNGDLNLRIFEILASGALLLTDRLAPASGLSQLLADGREAIYYDNEKDLVEKAARYLAEPREARAIGEAGALWFLRTLGQENRRRLFRELAFDGRPPAPFPLPEAEATAVHFDGTRELLASVMVYEGLQELHRTQEIVRVELDRSVPENFAQLCSTLPRVQVARATGATDADLQVTGTLDAAAATTHGATRVWCWDAGVAQLPELAGHFSRAGFASCSNELALFSRTESPGPSPSTLAAQARGCCQRGDFAGALELARTAFQRNPQCVDALAVLADLALLKGDGPLAEKLLRQARTLAPRDAAVAAALVEALLVQKNSVAVGAAITDALALDAGDAASPEVPAGHLLQRGWKMLVGGRAREAGFMAQEMRKLRPRDAGFLHFFARSLERLDLLDDASAAYRQTLLLAPEHAILWRERAEILFRAGRPAEALNDFLQAASLGQDDPGLREAIACTAEAVEHWLLAREATKALLHLRPGDANVEARLAAIAPRAAATEGEDGHDLIICHLEISRLHGTGVLLQRFFGGARNIITLRGNSFYKGKCEIAGLHLVLDMPDQPLAEVEKRMRQLLSGLKIRRILCVPYYPCDFVHGLLARRITGAPLCAYVMDDQTVHGTAVPQGVARLLFNAARLRLAISPEMASAYERAFEQPFGVLPPVLVSSEGRVENHWRPARGGAVHCGLVGNIWSLRQFEQLRACVREAHIRVDWFGNAAVPWLPQDRRQLKRDGVNCCGFLPESELARRLAEYPFVIVPSGELNGTEDNEWLTRLSLPSRMVFILAQACTPMLVLGHPDTAAARFVTQLGLGLCASYEPAAARAAMRELMTPAIHHEIVANARRVAPAFVMPRAGEWIWESLAAGRPLATALDELGLTARPEPLAEKISA